MKTEQAFNLFLEEILSEIQKKTTHVNHACWDLAIHGSKEGAQKLAQLNQELQQLLAQQQPYQQLLEWKGEGVVTSPDLLRTLKVLIDQFKVNQVPVELLNEISQLEADVTLQYGNFRAVYEGKELSENDVYTLLKNKTDVEKRKEIWKSCKQVGDALATPLLKLVKKRNEQAHRLGYSDYYKMKLEMDEVGYDWLMDVLNQFEQASQSAYDNMMQEINSSLAERYNVSPTSLGPWAWQDPFSQFDPLDQRELDPFIKDIDILAQSKAFFDSMGFDVSAILDRSDLYEKKGKNQHAFCLHLDRLGDIRTLNNIRPNTQWLEVLLHELGHAVYEQGYDKKLSWFLRVPPHMITTEAMALICGRHAYDRTFLESFIPKELLDPVYPAIQKTAQRRQLIFSRWVMVMVHFEAALYANPEQDLNNLWWSLVQKHQKICPPSVRSDKHDWACKCHFAIAPVYYHSYLLGEFFASMLRSHCHQISGSYSLFNQSISQEFLNSKVFFPGNRMRWDHLVQTSVGKALEYNSWMEEFC